MSNAEALIQVNLKSGVGYDATLINVYAQNGQQLVELLEAVKANAPLIAEAQGVVKFTHGAEVQQGSVQTQVSQPPAQQQYQQEPTTQQNNGGWGAPQSTGGDPFSSGQQQAPPSFAQPAQFGGDGGSETDKWGNAWEYGRPDAPATPRGPAVLKTGMSRDNKQYKRWEDPAKGPRWYASRQPKPQDHELWPGEFFKGR